MAEVELQQIGQYSLTGLLHTSSTGEIYRSKQRNKNIAIKRLRRPYTTNEAKEAFLLYAKQLKKLKSRDIIDTLDAGFDGDHAYLVMEYIPGGLLSQRISPGQRLAPDEVKRTLSPIASALHYAHLNNILHGNLHPAAIVIGERNDLRLGGFALPGQDEEAGALPYMSPEQLRGEPSSASDQYALAVMIYEWLCGQLPFATTDRQELIQLQQQPFPTPHDLNEAISPAVEQVLLRALSTNPGQRYPHTQAFADGYLSALIGFTVRSTPQPVRFVLPPLGQRNGAQPTPQNNGTNHSAESTSQTTTTSSETSEPAAANLDQRVDQLVAQVFHEARNDTSSQPAAGAPPSTPTPTPRPAGIFGESRLQSVVTTDLRQGGVLSRSLPGYEERPPQVEMAGIVATSLSQSTPAIIEASTGTGKSIAYLLPIVRSGRVALVSTANKALQEQLYYKDIPFIQQHIQPFTAALVKGVSNYVCLDRVESERVGMQHFTRNEEFQHLLEVIQDSSDDESSFNGDFETLGFQLPSDVRGRVATDSDQCAWSKCSFFSDCYVRKMRERAEMAQIIVVNHTLLLLDAAIGGFLLPERDVIVLDEAHHLEEEATRAFTITVSPNRITTLLAQRMLKDYSKVQLQDATMQTAQTTWASLEYTIDLGRKGRANLDTPLQEGLKLASMVSDLTDSLRQNRPKEMPDKESQLYDKLLKRSQNLAEDIRTVFSVAEPDKRVYYVERAEGGGRHNTHLQVSAAPLDVTSWLKEKLFQKCNVICTSATLATVSPGTTQPTQKGPNFVYFRRRTGLDPVERDDVLERILPLTFDYERNALLYLPRDLPAPAFGDGADDYMKSIAREMYRLVKLSRGRAFLLFSSKRMLDRAYELMAPHLNFPLLKQGDMTRLELTRRFREEEGAVLFGLKSFWEGVDIAGDALSLVVIDKLPFDPPDDPVHEARVSQMKAAGENWFGTYVLPQAVLRLKQGLGRLLRTREDRGVMAILDTRLHTKGYGKLVIGALPPAHRTSSLRDVERFFAET
ncbi:MAG: protein kinase [Ktedonobacteraceae bacterium]|nr:protein kinase [Ktedonobacteraceae bacterium]